MAKRLAFERGAENQILKLGNRVSILEAKELSGSSGSPYPIIDPADGSIVGEIGYDAGPPEGVYWVYLADEAGYVNTDGGILLGPSRVELHGTEINIDNMTAQTSTEPYAVYVLNGNLFPAPLPEPGWTVTDTDAGDYDLGSGTGQGPNVQMTGLAVTVPQAVTSGTLLEVYANIETVNKSATRSGSISFGFGVNGAAPTSWLEQGVGAGFDGYIPVALSTATATLAASDIIHMWARRQSGSHNQFGVDLLGSQDPHELIVQVAGAGGGLSDTGWVNLTLGTGWTNLNPASYHSGQYRIQNGIGYLRGVVDKTSWAANDTVATLPVGTRPPRIWLGHVRAQAGTGSNIENISISAAGLIQMASGGGGWISLDGIMYSTEL